MRQNKDLRDMLELVVSDINRCLEDRQWSAEQMSKGMEFVVHDDWLPLSSTLLKKYRAVGWIVKMTAKVEPGHRQYILNIKHPK